MAQAATVFRYSGPSALARADGGELDLRTWTPDDDRTGSSPHFFSGFVSRADLAATGLLAVAQVAGSRYFEHWTHARREAMNDPVVTSDGVGLRFESFSLCGGVHARLDLDSGALDGAFTNSGTTNVDVNPPLRTALARVLRGAPLRLRVGRDELIVETLTERIVEKQVALPERWVRGFAETQVAQSQMVPVLDLPNTEAMRLLRTLPRRSLSPVYVESNGTSWQLVSTPSDRTVPIVGTERLGVLSMFASSADRLTVFAPPSAGAQAASAWQFTTGATRLTLTVSPAPDRGFSGEGGILGAIAAELDARPLAVETALASRPMSTSDQLAADLGAAPEQIAESLAVLAVSGRVGFDLTHQSYFRRVLPYGYRTLEALNPRLRSASSLLDSHAVAFDTSMRRAVVTSGDHHHIVKLLQPTSVLGARCTCPWYAKHQGDRGPCKHVLAATIHARQLLP